MGAANITPIPPSRSGDDDLDDGIHEEGITIRDDAASTILRRVPSSTLSQYSMTQLSTIRLICKTDSALHAFLCFLDSQKEKQIISNFFQLFLFCESSQSWIEKIGSNLLAFQNFSDYAHLVHDDLAFSFEFLRQLQGSEQYLMVLSVICVLNDFMRSEWHTMWQKIEMQSFDPHPSVFPLTRGAINDKFTKHDNEIQYFLKTTEVKNVSDLLVNCLKHLPFPLVVMEMSHDKKWFPIASTNSAFEELTGYTEDEVKGLTVKTLNPDVDKEVMFNIRDEILNGKISRVALPLTKKNGDIMQCMLGVIPIFDSNRSILYFLALFDDITIPHYCLTRLNILSDLVDSLSCDINVSPSEENPFYGTSIGHMI